MARIQCHSHSDEDGAVGGMNGAFFQHEIWLLRRNKATLFVWPASGIKPSRNAVAKPPLVWR